jgi:drug/metabolite transporter (DMT)-like permease
MHIGEIGQVLGIPGIGEGTVHGIPVLPPPDGLLRLALQHADERLVWACIGIAALFICICVMLRESGWRAQAGACSFISCLSLTQLFMKRLTEPPLNYVFPGCITVLHFVVVEIVVVIYWAWQGDLNKCLPSSIGSAKRYCTRIPPVATSLSLSIVLNNMALSYIGAGLNAVLGSITPVITALLTRMLGQELSSTSWLGVVCVVAGSVIVSSELLLSGVSTAGRARIGIFISFSATLLRSCKVVFQDLLLNPDDYDKYYAKSESREKSRESFKRESLKRESLSSMASPIHVVTALDPMHASALQGPPCICVACLVAFSLESPMLAWALLTPQIGFLVMCTCVTALVLGLGGMILMKDVGANMMQLTGNLNIIVTMAMSMAFLAEVLAIEQLLGAVIVLVGVGIFQRGKS